MTRNIATSLAAAAFMALLVSPALADPVEDTPTIVGDQTYEIHDPADTPPVNYRSDEDARYDNPTQHDAEMYAEQYEQQRQERQIKEKKLLDNMNTLSAPGGPINHDLGANDAGFPARAPY